MQRFIKYWIIALIKNTGSVLTGNFQISLLGGWKNRRVSHIKTLIIKPNGYKRVDAAPSCGLDAGRSLSAVIERKTVPMRREHEGKAPRPLAVCWVLTPFRPPPGGRPQRGQPGYTWHATCALMPGRRPAHPPAGELRHRRWMTTLNQCELLSDNIKPHPLAARRCKAERCFPSALLSFMSPSCIVTTGCNGL